MEKQQFNVRLSPECLALVDALCRHYTAAAHTGREATKAEVVERAIRVLAKKEKIDTDLDLC